MKTFINIINSILLSLCVFFLVASFFFVNKRYIFNIMDDIKYEDIVYDNIVNELKDYDPDIKYELSKNDIKNDLNSYLNHDFEINNLKSKIYVENSNEDIEKIYISNIKFLDNINIIKLRYIVYIITIVLVLITGNLFNKYKYLIKIEYVLLLSSIISIFIYGYLYLFINMEEILEILLNNSLHIYLFVSCLEFCVSIILYNEEIIDKYIIKKIDYLLRKIYNI